jgi:hypothetical protein
MWRYLFIHFRNRRALFVFTLCICSGFHAWAQNSIQDAEICVGETVDFNKLITGFTQYDDNDVVGWYANGQKMHNRPYGFTDAPTVTTVYTLRFTTNGTLHEYHLTVTVHEPPVLVIPQDITICSGTSVLLDARVTNATSLTDIWWTYGGFIYNNGDLLDLSSTGVHTVTATATNTPLCPTKSEVLQVTVNFNATLAQGDPSTVTHCTGDVINLNDCINFFVYDTQAGNEKRAADSAIGTITWYNATTFMPIFDPVHVLLTSLNDTAFYAQLSGIRVFYSNTCTPSFEQSPNIVSLRVPIHITSNYFELDYGYDDICSGDSIYAKFRLLDDYGNPSPCDTIQRLDVLSGHTVIRQIRTSSTEKTLVFAPFTGLADTIRITAKGSLPNVEEHFKLFVRNPDPPVIVSEPVCKNTDAYFRVISDHCDTIYAVHCPTITAIPQLTSSQRWELRVPELPNTTPYQCEVTYFSKLENTMKKSQIKDTLEIWRDPPELSVYLLHENLALPFDNVTQNLCLGDSLRFVFNTPHKCDTIIDITGLPNSRLYDKNDHTWYFLVKPTMEGDNLYMINISYKEPKETTVRTLTIPYIVKAKHRPRLFINPPDTLKYCYPDDAPLNLNLPSPSHDIIDYNFVVSGPNAVGFLGPSGYTASFQPTVTDDYVVEANYKYSCSEMNTTHALGSVRIIVNSKTEEDASFIITPPKEGFCILGGITVRSANKEGSSLSWELNGQPVTFPYHPANPGTYTLTTLIHNACYPLNNPKRYDLDVLVVPIPVVEVMPDTTVCHGDTVALKTRRFVGDRLTWTLTTGVTTKDSVAIYSTTTFHANADNICGTVSDEVTVYRMVDASVRLMPDTAVCTNDEIRLRVLQKEGDITWSNTSGYIGMGETILTHVIRAETYTVIASNQCGRDTAYLHVAAWPSPYLKVIPDTSLCYGTSLDLEKCVIGYQFGSLQWTPSQSTSLTEPAVYIATVTSQHHCGSVSDTTYVNVYLPLILLPDDSNLPRYNRQDFYEASFQTLQAAPVLTYSINGTLPPGLTLTNGRIHGYPALGPYDYNTHRLQVTVTDGHQCRASREYTLAPEWKAATVLLPMGDAENAVFLPGYNLEVYNRNGLLVHKGLGWDGTWNNAFVPSGTYFYKVKILIDDIPEERMSYVVVMYY